LRTECDELARRRRALKRTSAGMLGYNPTSGRSSTQDFPSWRLPLPSTIGQIILLRGRSDSPVRKTLQEDAVSSERLRRSPSKTFIRAAPPLKFLDTSAWQNPKVKSVFNSKLTIDVIGESRKLMTVGGVYYCHSLQIY
jgi:hypothetical protein